MEHYI